MIDPPINIPFKQLKTVSYKSLKGRMLHLPAKGKSKKKILVLYGHHASLERMYSNSKFMSRFGEVFQPDWPGFGGMDSFYEIGLKPTHDNYADYLYDFMKHNGLTKNVTVVGMSIGGQYVTRMLQKHPESQKWIKQYIGMVSFTGPSEFIIKPLKKYFIIGLSYFSVTRPTAWFMQKIVYSDIATWIFIRAQSPFKAKMQHKDENVKKDMIQMERALWQQNDARTHAYTALQIFKVDLVALDKKKISTPFHNMTTKRDQYVDVDLVQTNFKKVFKNYSVSYLDSHVHAPSIVASEEEAASMMSEEAIKVLSKK